jgi:polysaccharide export outer membrane protein
MFRRIPVGVFGLALLVLPASARQNSAPPPASAPQAAPKSATVDPNYVIGPQDILDVSVWKEPEVSRSVPVRPDGKISLPLLNDVQAAGLTPGQLMAQISTGLGKFMTNPEVTVIVTAINSQRVYILGEVSRSGGYVLLPGLTVLQALSNAGGLTQFANGKKIYVLRPDGPKQDKLYFNYKEVLDGKHPEQNVVLKPGDTVVVP